MMASSGSEKRGPVRSSTAEQQVSRVARGARRPAAGGVSRPLSETRRLTPSQTLTRSW